MSKISRVKKNLISITTVLLITIFSSIGYAAFTKTLNINGTTEIAPVSWDIHFENLVSPTFENGQIFGDAILISNPSISQTYLGGYTVRLSTLGDKVIIGLKIVNNGDLNAVISSINLPKIIVSSMGAMASSDETLVLENIIYNIKYDDTLKNTLKIGDTLDAGESKSIFIEVGYDENALDVPKELVSIDFGTTTINYRQA